MKKIILLCAMGMSTSFTVKKIADEFTKRNIDVDIHARSDDEISDYIDDIDLVILAPQVKFREKEICELCTKRGKKLTVFSSDLYGSMDGKRLVDFILPYLE